MLRNLYIFSFDEIKKVKEAILFNVDFGIDVKVPVKVF